jgi:hypothetical protein
MSNLQRRGSYTPRRAREQRAYRLAIVSAGTGGIGVIGVVLAAVGVVSWSLPIILLIVAALSAFGFLRTTGQR